MFSHISQKYRNKKLTDPYRSGTFSKQVDTDFNFSFASDKRKRWVCKVSNTSSVFLYILVNVKKILNKWTDIGEVDYALKSLIPFFSFFSKTDVWTDVCPNWHHSWKNKLETFQCQLSNHSRELQENMFRISVIFCSGEEYYYYWYIFESIFWLFQSPVALVLDLYHLMTLSEPARKWSASSPRWCLGPKLCSQTSKLKCNTWHRDL